MTRTSGTGGRARRWSAFAARWLPSGVAGGGRAGRGPADASAAERPATSGAGARRGPGATRARFGAALMLAACAAGCGIRTTSVPVDAGAAPSRLPCKVSDKDVITQARPGVPVRVYLVCASRLVSVERTTRIGRDKPVGDRTQIAQALLDELQATPPSDERDAGFSTSVPGPLLLSGADGDDPSAALRLSRRPQDLPPEALAQIVCTFAESEVTDGTVVLAGPHGDAPRNYACTEPTKRGPDRPMARLPLPARG